MRNKVYNFKAYSDGLKNNEFETSSLSCSRSVLVIILG